MPLGKRWETTDSKYCGVETDFSKDVHSLLSFNIDYGRFDFVLAPLMEPSYRPSLDDESSLDTKVHPFTTSDLVVSPLKWRVRVTGKISSWIDLDSENEIVRMDSEIALKKEIAWAKHLSIRSCLLPSPKGTSCANYARCVNQILQGLDEMELWLRIPLMKDQMNFNSDKDSWKIWNSFRLLCDLDSKLSVALDVQSNIPSTNSLDLWFGESVKAAIISTECFIPTFQRCTYLLKSHEELIKRFFHHSVQVIISGKPIDTEGKEIHPHKPYLDYLSNLFCKMEPLSEQARRMFNHRDRLETPLQPLKDNLEANTYEAIEGDSVKYTQYQRAIAKALEQRVCEEKASELTTVLMVVGAGRGPLVTVSLQAAAETGRKLKVYAVEKNPYAVVALHDLVKMRGWEGIVTIISDDMRVWNAPEKADILVSELLGSFGDNELSPECLDGAERFLKPNGISIPFSYTSFIQPITTSKLYNTLMDRWKKSHYAYVYSVNLHSVARLAPSQPVFTFTHPNFSTKPNNQRYTSLRFNLPSETGSALVHGFAGYFEAVLYDDVCLSIEPTTATPNLLGWFPLFFPLMKPVEVHSKSPLEVHFWRCSDSTKVWYEWTVSMPIHLPIHNSNGSSDWMSL